MIAEIKDYVKKRDKALKGSVKDFIAWARNEPKLKRNAIPCDEVLEVTYHKIRLEVKSISEREKQKSREWLAERGYMPLRRIDL